MDKQVTYFDKIQCKDHYIKNNTSVSGVTVQDINFKLMNMLSRLSNNGLLTSNFKITINIEPDVDDNTLNITTSPDEYKHAFWIKPTSVSSEFCQHCGLSPKMVFGMLPTFCPHCGYKMDLGTIKQFERK